MSNWLLNKRGGCRADAEALLRKYRLEVTEDTTEALAKRIMFLRLRADTEAKLREEKARLERWDAKDQAKAIEDKLCALETTTDVRAKGQRNPTTPSIRKALTHTSALLRYAKKPPSRDGSIPKRQKALYDALSDLSVVVALSLCRPPIDVNQILNQKTLSPHNLEHLLVSLAAYIDGPRHRTGRPKDTHALIIASAVRCWKQAGNEIQFSYYDRELKGDFPSFLFDLYELCKITPPSGDAIKNRLNVIAKTEDFSP